MGKMARDKGARGEREVKDLYNALFERIGYNVAMQRNSSGQADGGGYDLVGLQYLAIEVKWQETNYSKAWWSQCIAQCKEGQIPVLWYRRSRMPWRIRQWGLALPAQNGSTTVQIELSVEDHLRWLEEKIRSDSDTTKEEAGC